MQENNQPGHHNSNFIEPNKIGLTPRMGQQGSNPNHEAKFNPSKLKNKITGNHNNNQFGSLDQHNRTLNPNQFALSGHQGYNTDPLTKKLHQVFLSCLPNDTTKEDLMDLYSSRGKIEDLILWTRGLHDTSTYAVIKTYSESLNNYLLNTPQKVKGTEVFSRIYYSKEEKALYLKDMRERRIKLHGIPREMSDAQLIHVIKSTFKTEKAYSIRGEDGLSKGTGFVIFATKQESERALETQDMMGHLKLDLANLSKMPQSKKQKLNLLEDLELERVAANMKLILERCVDKESRVQGLLFRDIDHSMELKTIKNVEIVKKFKQLKKSGGITRSPLGQTPPNKRSSNMFFPGSGNNVRDNQKNQIQRNRRNEGNGQPLRSFGKESLFDMPHNYNPYFKVQQGGHQQPNLDLLNQIAPRQGEQPRIFDQLNVGQGFQGQNRGPYKMYSSYPQESFFEQNSKLTKIGSGSNNTLWHPQESDMDTMSKEKAKNNILANFRQVKKPPSQGIKPISEFLPKKPGKRSKKKNSKDNLALKGKPNPGFKIFHRCAIDGIMSLTGIIGLSHCDTKNIRFNNPVIQSISNHSLVWKGKSKLFY